MPTRQIKLVERNGYSLGLSLLEYQEFLKTINLAISEFNSSTDDKLKLTALSKMEKAIETLDTTLTPSGLQDATPFHVEKIRLFKDIKEAYTNLGVPTLLREGKDDTPIARLISDMSLQKADQLMGILHQGREGMYGPEKDNIQSQLKTLYDDTDRSIEAEQWRKFIQNHSIEYLGGNNSKNYKITPILGGEGKILKVDNRLNMPRHVEMYLRGALGPVFTPIDAERQVLGKDPSGWLVSRTLLVTDLCQQGSVDQYGKTKSSVGIKESYSSCTDIMGKMAQVFIDIQAAGCCFPDSKLTNWLVDEKQQIRMADTKSFVFIDNKGQYQRNLDSNKDLNLIRTPGFSPDEIGNASFDAEKLHASILGRNIYSYLTGLWPYYIDLDNDIFKTMPGPTYKNLIKELTKDPAKDRMSIKVAYHELFKIAHPEYKALYDRTEALSEKTGIECLPYLVDKATANAAGSIDALLKEVEKNHEKNIALKTQMKALKISLPNNVEQTALYQTENAKSLEELNEKTKLLVQCSELVLEYNTLKTTISANKAPRINVYVALCDIVLEQGSSLSDQLKTMRQVVANIKKTQQTLAEPTQNSTIIDNAIVELLQLAEVSSIKF